MGRTSCYRDDVGGICGEVRLPGIIIAPSRETSGFEQGPSINAVLTLVKPGGTHACPNPLFPQAAICCALIEEAKRRMLNTKNRATATGIKVFIEGKNAFNDMR